MNGRFAYWCGFLFCFLMASPSFAKLLDEAACLEKVHFGPFNDGVHGVTIPKVPFDWSIRQTRTLLETNYLTEAEIKAPAYFAMIDSGAIDLKDERLSCLVPEEECTPGDILCHASATTATVSSKAPCAVAPAEGTRLAFYHPVRDPAQFFTRYRFLGIFSFSLKNKEAYTDFIMSGLRHVLEYNQNPDNQHKIKVVNISLIPIESLDETDIELLDAIQKDNSFNVTWALGNDGQNRADFSNLVKDYPFIIPVSALSESRKALESYSNYGQRTDFSIPVGNSFTTIGGEVVGGTSLAAPVVAGAILSLAKVNPEADATTIRAILKATAMDVGFKGHDLVTGYGIPNIPLAAAVMRHLKNNPAVKDAVVKAAVQQNQSFESMMMVTTQTLIKAGDFHIKNFAHKQRSTLPLNDFEPVNYQALQALDSCDDYGILYSRMMYSYFLLEGATKMSQELCAFYQTHNLTWGIANFCPTTATVERLLNFQDNFFYPTNQHRGSQITRNIKMHIKTGELSTEEIMTLVKTGRQRTLSEYPTQYSWFKAPIVGVAAVDSLSQLHSEGIAVQGLANLALELAVEFINHRPYYSFFWDLPIPLLMSVESLPKKARLNLLSTLIQHPKVTDDMRQKLEEKLLYYQQIWANPAAKK